jgi:hypothetical protein
LFGGAVVQSETAVRWHRQGFRYFWRWKSRGRGSPAIDPAIIRLIRRICRANPLWGAPPIHGGLMLTDEYLVGTTWCIQR